MNSLNKSTAPFLIASTRTTVTPSPALTKGRLVGIIHPFNFNASWDGASRIVAIAPLNIEYPFTFTIKLSSLMHEHSFIMTVAYTYEDGPVVRWKRFKVFGAKQGLLNVPFYAGQPLPPHARMELWNTANKTNLLLEAPLTIRFGVVYDRNSCFVPALKTYRHVIFDPIIPADYDPTSLDALFQSTNGDPVIPLPPEFEYPEWDPIGIGIFPPAESASVFYFGSGFVLPIDGLTEDPNTYLSPTELNKYKEILTNEILMNWPTATVSDFAWFYNAVGGNARNAITYITQLLQTPPDTTIPSSLPYSYYVTLIAKVTIP